MTNEQVIDNLLAQVDIPNGSSDPVDPEELPAWIKVQAEQAAKTAYFQARAESKSKDEATGLAAAAYEAKANALLSPQASPAASMTRSPAAAPSARRPTPAPVPRVRKARISAGGHDAEGAQRSQDARAALLAAGFAPKEPIYRAGTRVDELGVANARRSRLEHDAKPSVSDACGKLCAKIHAENRRMIEASSASLSMTSLGLIDGLGGDAIHITEDAFRGLTGRLGYGGAAYLSKCPPELRAYNFNDWRSRVDPDQRLALRVRDRAPNEAAGDPGGPEIFAAVSPNYAAFDADMIAEAVAGASPPEAKGSFAYDGTRSRFEVHFHSNVRPASYVAGEFFKAGCLVSTDDTGGGSIVVRSIAWQNLCLNLIVIDKCAKEIARIKHVGSVAELREKLEGAYAQALASLAHFMQAWNYACRDNVCVSAKESGLELPASTDKALPGIFRGVLDAGLVKLPRAGSFKAREEAIAVLCELFEGDHSGAKLSAGISRAAIVNAFTAYARDLDGEDPWAADEIQRDAGALLWGGRRGERGPSPLPYMEEAIEDKRGGRSQLV